MKLSDRLANIKPSPVMEISARARAMTAQGTVLARFDAGEPDFDTPEFVKESAIKALGEGKTKYTEAAGIPQLRDALVDYYKRTEGLEYTREETIFSMGGKHSLYNIFQALIGEGDEVIIPTPYWVSYSDQVLLAGGRPVFLKCREEDGFALCVDELEKLITKKTRTIIVNSPCNPTGVVLDDDILKNICALAVKHKVFVIWDEIYKDIYYGDGRLGSLPAYNPAVKPYTLICAGLSKNFSMTGWRIGWTLGDARVIKAMSVLQSQSTSNPVTFAQYGALAALDKGPVHLGDWLSEFRARRDKLLSAFEVIPGITCVKPEGAFYLFPNVSGWFGKSWEGGKIESSFDVARFLLDKARAVVVPGAPFGAPDNIRISYALGMDDLEEGIARIHTAAKTLV